jgi:hypothetical protein
MGREKTWISLICLEGFELTVAEHSRRYVLICKSVCDSPMVSGVMGEDRPEPYLTDEEWEELAQLDEALEAELQA